MQKFLSFLSSNEAVDKRHLFKKKKTPNPSLRWLRLHAQHTVIKIHILIKAPFQTRCPHAQRNIPIYVLISIFWTSQRCTLVAVAASWCWWPGALCVGSLLAKTPIPPKETNTFLSFLALYITVLVHTSLVPLLMLNNGSREREEGRQVDAREVLHTLQTH